jgi:hypothetical protein
MQQQACKTRSVFSQAPSPVALLVIGACVGAVAVTVAYLFLGLVQTG